MEVEPEEIYDLLDLVVVSIASDIVPVTGENRVLAYYGLKKLNSNPGIGLQTIINLAGLNGSEITISDIVFKIGPRLNASGRIEHGKKSVQILVSNDEDQSDILGEEIDSFNEIRKTLDRDITQEALDMILNDPLMNGLKSTVLYNRDWHKGVVGIVASTGDRTILPANYYFNRIERNGYRLGTFGKGFRFVRSHRPVQRFTRIVRRAHVCCRFNACELKIFLNSENGSKE